MAKSSVNLHPKESKIDRLRRELRNPSMVTVILVIFVVVAVPVGIMMPSWVDTTRNSLDERRSGNQSRDDSMLSITAMVPSQVVPWLFAQINTMTNATSPGEWTGTSFKAGPCYPDNLAQLPPGPYAIAIADACSDLGSIQSSYAQDCPNVANCNFPQAAKDELALVKSDLTEAFSDAGFVLPYTEEEQSVGP